MTNLKEQFEEFSSDEGGKAVERMHPTDRDRLFAWVETKVKEARQSTIDEIWNILLDCLPSDAENLDSASRIPRQSQELLTAFLKRLEDLNK